MDLPTSRVFYIGNDRGDGELHGATAVGGSFGKPTSAQCWSCTNAVDREFLMIGTPSDALEHGIRACLRCNNPFV